MASRASPPAGSGTLLERNDARSREEGMRSERGFVAFLCEAAVAAEVFAATEIPSVLGDLDVSLARSGGDGATDIGERAGELTSSDA